MKIEITSKFMPWVENRLITLGQRADPAITDDDAAPRWHGRGPRGGRRGAARAPVLGARRPEHGISTRKVRQSRKGRSP